MNNLIQILTSDHFKSRGGRNGCDRLKVIFYPTTTSLSYLLLISGMEFVKGLIDFAIDRLYSLNEESLQIHHC